MNIPRYVKVNPLSGFFINEEDNKIIWDTNKPFPTYLECCTGYNWQQQYEMNNMKWWIEVSEQEYNKQEGIINTNYYFY